MTFAKTLASGLMAALAACLVACGGGGGGGEGNENALAGTDNALGATDNAPGRNDDPPFLDAPVATGEVRSSAVPFSLILSGSSAGLARTPTEVLQVADEPPFKAGPVSWRATSADRFELQVPVKPNVPVGKYQGTLRFQLCLDAPCGQRPPETTREVPYEVTVRPGLRLTLSIDGVPSGASDEPLVGGMPVAPMGAVLTIVASEPVRWDYNPVFDPSYTNVTSTATTWTGTPSGRILGAAFFEAGTVEAPFDRAGVTFLTVAR